MSAIELSPKQLEAVNAEGPVLVTGPAGSGKTETIIQRIFKRRKYIDFGNDRYFVLTHTRATRYKYLERLNYRGTVKNIHAACFSEIEGWRGTRPIVWGTSRSVKRIEGILRSKGLLQRYDKYIVYCYITYIKNFQYEKTPFGIDKETISILPEFRTIHEEISTLPDISHMVKVEGWPRSWKSEIPDVIYQYQCELVKSKALDLNDLLLFVYFRIINQADRSDIYRSRGILNMSKDKTLYVDDIQDFNWLQYRIFQEYSRHATGLYVASDPNYIINQFRGGAHTTNQLLHDTPKIKVIQLPQISYRSTSKISLITEFLKSNKFDYPVIEGKYEVRKIPSSTLSEFIEGNKGFRYLTPPAAGYNPIAILETTDEITELDSIVRFIRYILSLKSSDKNRYRHRDILLLYPKYSQGKELEETLMSSGIPCVEIGRWDENSRATHESEKEDKVGILSLYRSKGLEAKIVILIGLEDPDSDHSIGYREDNVNALLHIGINRAREYVLLCWTSSRGDTLYESKLWIERLQSFWTKANQREIANYKKRIDVLKEQITEMEASIKRRNIAYIKELTELKEKLKNSLIEKAEAYSEMKIYEKRHNEKRKELERYIAENEKLQNEVTGFQMLIGRTKEQYERMQNMILELNSELTIGSIPFGIRVRRVNHEVGTVMAKSDDSVTVMLKDGRTEEWLVRELQKVIE